MFLQVGSWESSELYNMMEVKKHLSYTTPGKILVKVLVHKEKEKESKHWQIIRFLADMNKSYKLSRSQREKNGFHIFKNNT